MNPSPAPMTEHDALDAVARSARAQLDALRDASPEAFEDAAAQTLDAVAALDRAQTARRASATAAADRTTIRAAAIDARQACDELEFALGHAVALGRDLITAWQQMSVPTTAHVYTARGQVGAPDGAGRIRQTG